jgi:hypothetical protein
MKVEIKPFIFRSFDYHDFLDFKEKSKFAGIDFEFEEVGFDGRYCAVFWISGDEQAAFTFMMMYVNSQEKRNIP